MPKVVVVYESMYGNTHLIADAIGKGFGQAATAEIVVVPVAEAEQHLDRADLIVVGGPTHTHGMSRATTRQAAVDTARNSQGKISADRDAEGPGLRDWFEHLGTVPRARRRSTHASGHPRCSRDERRSESRGSSFATGARSSPTRRASSSPKTTISSPTRRSGRAPGARSSRLVWSRRRR